MTKLIHNRIRCNKCGDIIESKYTHDFVQCSCGQCFVDGGHDYMRVSGDYTDLSEWVGMLYAVIRLKDGDVVDIHLDSKQEVAEVGMEVAKSIIEFDNGEKAIEENDGYYWKRANERLKLMRVCVDEYKDAEIE